MGIFKSLLYLFSYLHIKGYLLFSRSLSYSALLIAILFNSAAFAHPPQKAEEQEKSLIEHVSTNVAIGSKLDPLDDNDGESAIENILIYGHRADQIGASISASEGSIGRLDIEQRVTSRAGEILEFVPGMVVTQHSGSGKANQYFLRGFNLDHGTDFQTTVESIPVNQRTHGHGQGYTDLNFIVPEFIQRIDYQKGPYHAEDGDFSTAGSAKFQITKQLEQSIASAELGEYGFKRAVVGKSLKINGGNLLVGAETQTFDGPWTNVKEDVKKFNGLIKYSQQNQDEQYSFTFLAYDNSWNSADQIPLRSVNSGQLDRFATVDPTTGGESSRYSLSADWQNANWKANAYIVQSNLDLFSNFTYFLVDPINGDQFEQVDDRMSYGGSLVYHNFYDVGGKSLLLQSGVQIHYDDIDEVGLHQTRQRQRLSTTRNDAVEEYSVGVFWEAELELTDALTSNLSLRYDYFDADVDSNISQNSGKADDALTSLKAGLRYTINDNVETYFNVGQSYHSNDARGVTSQVDPVTRESIDPVDLLVRGEGGEIGIRFQRPESYNISLALWLLELDSELLFVGDAGNTEASRASRRSGIELSAYYWFNTKFSADFEYALTRSRFTEDVIGEGNRVDNSLPLVVSAGVNWKPIEPLNINVRMRHFGRRILESLGEVRGDRFTVLNLGLTYDFKQWQFGLDILNLLNSDDRDIEYFFESRLPGEPQEGVADIHFHPIQPRSTRAKVTYRF